MIDNSLKWPTQSTKQANFIKINQIEQKTQFGYIQALEISISHKSQIDQIKPLRTVI